MFLKNYVFDFDGTLVDTFRDVLDSLKCAFEKCHVAVSAFDTGTIMQFQLTDVIRTLVPHITPAQSEQVAGRFREIYDSMDYPNTVLMPTVGELLPMLKARSSEMFIVSNKRAVPTLRILDKFNIRHFFSGIFNPDMFKGGRAMTKPELLAYAIKEHSLAKNSTVYIGDSGGDVTAAKENGVVAIAVQNGYGYIPSFKIKPDYTFRQIIEILTV